MPSGEPQPLADSAGAASPSDPLQIWMLLGTEGWGTRLNPLRILTHLLFPATCKVSTISIVSFLQMAETEI